MQEQTAPQVDGVFSNTCFLGELGYRGQHRGVPGLQEVDHKQSQSIVAEEGTTSWVSKENTVKEGAYCTPVFSP